MSRPTAPGLDHVVRFVTDLPLDPRLISEELEVWSRSSLLDTLAALVAGTATTLGLAGLRAAAAEPGTSSIPGTRLCTTPTWAAMAGATAASALDFDDGHYAGGGIHPGSTILPTLLAGATPQTRLDRLRAALVAGYEVAIRAGRLASPSVSGLPYRASGYATTVGATAALCNLNAASHEVTSAALRIALAHAPVAEMVSEGAREAAGWAAATALGAYRLAAAGSGAEAEKTGSSPGPFPVGPTIFDLHSTEPMLLTLGKNYECLDCYLKPYPCCRAAHAPIDGLRLLADRHGWDRIRASSLRIGVGAGASTLDHRNPATLAQAQYSIPILLAVLAVHGESRLRALGIPTTDGNLLRDPAILAYARRVTVEHVPELDHNPWHSYPAVVELHSDNVTLDTARIDHASGSPQAPLSHARRLAKAHGLLSRVLTTDRQSRIIALVDRGAGTLSDLLRLSEPERASRGFDVER
ncbi:MAG: MmgE/PrpD family protein [Propionibacteriaceae bacterium]|nr:MmgE/PrpD family protein [Propionibacteriaceae bacterium]